MLITAKLDRVVKYLDEFPPQSQMTLESPGLMRSQEKSKA